MSDIGHLFPNLNLDEWDKTPTEGDGHDDPRHAGVTDDQIEAYLQQMGALRAPLSPIVSGQQQPQTPEFFNNGRAVPAGGNATVEPPQEVEAPLGPAAEEVSQGEEPETESTVPPPPSTVEIGGRTYDRQEAEAWAQFDQMLASDPQLQQLLTNYLQGRGNAPAQAPAEPSPPTSPLPDLPPQYTDDEYMVALHNQMRAQQDQLDVVRKQAQFAQEISASNIQRQYTEIAQSAITEFQKSHELDDDTMGRVIATGRSTGFAGRYMQGTDPLTGVPVTPDPYKATMSMLDAGYLLTPETRTIDTEREIERRASRAQQDATRKQKLAGVSGAAGSVPRTQPVPNNPNDSRAAMVSEVESMLNGNWIGDGNS